MDLYAVGATCALFFAGLLSPGPNVMVIAAASATSGRRAGVVVGLGVAFGDVIYATVALAGLAGAIGASESLFSWIKLLGGAYLVWMGVTMARGSPARHGEAPAPAPRSSWFRRGLVTDLANAHTAVFFASVFAGTLSADTTLATKTAIVLAIAVTSLAWRLSLATFFSVPPLRRLYDRRRRVFEIGAGAVLAATGARIALQR